MHHYYSKYIIRIIQDIGDGGEQKVCSDGKSKRKNSEWRRKLSREYGRLHLCPLLTFRVEWLGRERGKREREGVVAQEMGLAV